MQNQENFTLGDGSVNSSKKVLPCVFDYVDFRFFLKDSFMFLRLKNKDFSESAFLQKAGFGKNSRGYLKLIVEGKRNLSSKTISGFSRALNLTEKETLHFENLVNHNQAESEKDKNYYFARLSRTIQGKTNHAYSLLKSQYNYLSNWYLASIRELVSFANFTESQDWIRKMLRDRISKKEIKEAINDLLNLGLLQRDSSGKLHQSESLIQFVDDSLNYTTASQFHAQVLDLAKDALFEDPYKNRTTSCVILSCQKKQFSELRQEIATFRAHILNKFGANGTSNDAIFSVSIQLFYITPIEKEINQ